MDLREHYIGFYDAVSGDVRISPLHISVYMAILYQYLLQETGDAVHVTRQVLMQHAKISARSTYNKCMNELHDYGYIRYLPTCSYYLPSIVYIKRI
jgi:hypothetical protein